MSEPTPTPTPSPFYTWPQPSFPKYSWDVCNPLSLNSSTNLLTLACNYANALYKASPASSRKSSQLWVCNTCQRNIENECVTDPYFIPAPHPEADLPPIAWTLNELIGDNVDGDGPNGGIVRDAWLFWNRLDSDDCEPNETFVNDILGGPLDKPSACICPLAIEPGFTGDAGLLRQYIGYYNQFLTARTYYIDVCTGSLMYMSYLMYLREQYPAFYTQDPDWSNATSVNFGNTLLSGIINPSTLLFAWKSPSAPPDQFGSPGPGPCFAQWLWDETGGPCFSKTNPFIPAVLNFIVPFIGKQCAVSAPTDMWWTDYNIDATIADNYGTGPNSMSVGNTKYITNIFSTLGPIPALRITWEDAWYPFVNNPSLSPNLGLFASSLCSTIDSAPFYIGPVITDGPGGSCATIGSCCVGTQCVANVDQCQATIIGGEWTADPCDPNPCISPTPSVTPTNTTTPTLTVSPTSTISMTPSVTPSVSLSSSMPPTNTPTSTPSVTPTNTPSVTPTNTSSVTPTNTSSVTPTNTSSITPSVTPTMTSSTTPTITPSQSFVSPSPTPSISPT